MGALGKVSYSLRTVSRRNSLAFPGCVGESMEEQVLLAAVLKARGEPVSGWG